MAAADRHRTRRGWLLLALLGPLALSAWWFWRRPPQASPSRLDAALDRAIAPVLEQHAAEARLRTSSARQVRVLARQLALDSVPYLVAPADLELWAALRLELARASPAACARLWKGADEAFLAQGLAALGDEKLRAYSELLARGLALRLERKTPPQVAPNALDRGLAAVEPLLPEQQRAGFAADSPRRQHDDPRACQLFLQLSTGAERLEQAQRTELYRALAAEPRASSRPGAAMSPR
jgi:hypothetical protein